MSEWLFLLLAIIFEVCGTSSMKLSRGFTELAPSVAMLVLYALSLASLNLALKKIDVSVAYAIWSGIGTAMIVLIGIFFFREPVTVLKITSIILIILGVVGLNLGGGVH